MVTSILEFGESTVDRAHPRPSAALRLGRAAVKPLTDQQLHTQSDSLLDSQPRYEDATEENLSGLEQVEILSEPGSQEQQAGEESPTQNGESGGNPAGSSIDWFAQQLLTQAMELGDEDSIDNSVGSLQSSEASPAALSSSGGPSSRTLPIRCCSISKRDILGIQPDTTGPVRSQPIKKPQLGSKEMTPARQAAANAAKEVATQGKGHAVGTVSQIIPGQDCTMSYVPPIRETAVARPGRNSAITTCSIAIDSTSSSGQAANVVSLSKSLRSSCKDSTGPDFVPGAATNSSAVANSPAADTTSHDASSW
jgi:hypothetical protein